jgi:hypothetical protein
VSLAILIRDAGRFGRRDARPQRFVIEPPASHGARRATCSIIAGTAEADPDTVAMKALEACRTHHVEIRAHNPRCHTKGQERQHHDDNGRAGSVSAWLARLFRLLQNARGVDRWLMPAALTMASCRPARDCCGSSAVIRMIQPRMRPSQVIDTTHCSSQKSSKLKKKGRSINNRGRRDQEGLFIENSDCRGRCRHGAGPCRAAQAVRVCCRY